MDEFSQFAGRPFEVVDVATPEVLVGGLFGVGMVFAFAGMAIAAVGRAAQRVVLICREAFKSDPGILAGTSLPNYERVVSVVTQAALSEMVAPGVLCVGAPVAVGFAGRFVGELTGRPLLGAEVLAGYLVFGTVSGILMALFLDNVGGAWDNAKKYCEKDGTKVTTCVEINRCVGCTRRFFTKSFLGDDAAVLAPLSGEEPASPRHRAGVASMACRTTRRFRTNAL